MDGSHVAFYAFGAVALGWILHERYGARPKAPPPPPVLPYPHAAEQTQLLRDALLDLHPRTMRTTTQILHAADAAVMRQHLHQSYLRNLDMPLLPQWIEGLTTPELTAPAPVERVASFKPDEPQRLHDYIGQGKLRQQLQIAVAALAPDEFVLRHKLLTGLPGFGKTLLAKIIANELHLRAQAHGQRVDFVETYAANLNSVDALDDLVRSFTADTPVVWFIDEIHVLDKLLQTKIYLLMEEGRYPFEGDLSPTTIPQCMVLGATTDYGMLHPALKRRFGEGLMLQPLSQDELRQMAQTLGFAITADATDLLVSRCVHSGAPHELKTLFQECVQVAKATRQTSITTAVVTQVFETYEVDALGLRPIDRKVLHAMRQRPRYRGRTHELIGYGASENDVCMASGVDKGEFRDVIRPRLMTRGLIEVRPGIGLALTDRAVTTYA